MLPEPMMLMVVMTCSSVVDGAAGTGCGAGLMGCIKRFGHAALARELVAFAGNVFADRGDGFRGESLDYVQVVAGQDEDADTVLDGQLGQCLRSLLAPGRC
jgi:hypothetical protein